MSKELVITADDYGFTPGVNRGIESCVRAGAVKSVCAMTTMPHWQEIAEMARAHRDVSIGIHWSVTQGRPVLPPSHVASLLDSGKEFLPPRLFRQRLRRGGIDLNELEAELTAQVHRLRDLVPDVAYWNTHQNIHVTWKLYEVFSRIGRSLGIKAMRSHRRILVRGSSPGALYYARHPVFWLKGVVLRELARRASRRGTAMPAGRITNMTYRPGDPEMLRSLGRTDWDGVAELVIHPADTLEGLASMSTMVQSRVDEFALFSSRDTSRRLADLGIGLVNFAVALPEAS